MPIRHLTHTSDDVRPYRGLVVAISLEVERHTTLPRSAVCGIACRLGVVLSVRGAAMSSTHGALRASLRHRFVKAPPELVRHGLLAAGAASSALYVVATDFVAASKWYGYRRTEQMVSELFAVGSPAHGLLVPFSWLYVALTTAFGIGVWSSARGHRPLRIAGWLLTAYGLWNIAGLVYPLHLDDDASVPMHIVATNIQLALMIAAMSFVAAGFPGRMRWYTIASLVTSMVAGMLAFAAAPGPNLVLGLGERLSIGAFLLWVVMLAIALWREPHAPSGRPDH